MIIRGGVGFSYHRIRFLTHCIVHCESLKYEQMSFENNHSNKRRQKMKPVISIVFTIAALVNSVYAQQDDITRFKLAVKFMQAACASGEKIQVEGKANGGISILKKGGSGSFEFSRTELNGMVSSVNESIRVEENRQIRECMQPHIAKIISMIATQNDEQQIHSELPNNQWMKVGMQLPILDGKVTVIITGIQERGDRRAGAHIFVDVPRRSRYGGEWLTDTDNFNFEYYGKSYKLTVTNIDLDRQRAKITIIER